MINKNSVFISTVIPTIGRATLSRSVESVLNQQFSADGIEVIVVNDSGKMLPEEEWQSNPCVKIIETNRRNRSVARNAGAAIASGQYLHFLDDDDWILPGAFEQFWKLAQDNPVDWIYGGFRLIDDSGQKLADILPDATGNVLIQMLSFEWLPLQASIIKSEAFFSAGCFASLDSLLGGFEDIDLSRQIALRGDFSATNELVAMIRIGFTSSTTNYNDMFIQNRQSREKLLDAPEVFSKLRQSVRGSVDNRQYWSGRIAYYYLSSLKKNIKNKSLTKAASRGVYVVASFMTAGRNIFSAGYYRALTEPHYNRVWQAIEQVGAAHVYDGVNWNSGAS